MKKSAPKSKQVDQLRSKAEPSGNAYTPLFTEEEKQQLSQLYDKTKYGVDAGSPLLWALNKVCQNYTDTTEYLLRHGLFTNYKEADYV